MTGYQSKKAAARDKLDSMEREALKLALEALEYHTEQTRPIHQTSEAITAIKEALAQPEQEQDATMQSLKDLWRSVCDGVGKAAFAQPAQEPVAFINAEQRTFEWAKPTSWHTPTVVNLPKISLYTAPPQRPWVGLTDQEAQLIYDMGRTPTGMMEMVEAMLKEKNNG